MFDPYNKCSFIYSGTECVPQTQCGCMRGKGKGAKYYKVIQQESIYYEGRAKRSVTNRLPKFYPRYILKCFTALG